MASAFFRFPQSVTQWFKSDIFTYHRAYLFLLILVTGTTGSLSAIIERSKCEKPGGMDKKVLLRARDSANPNPLIVPEGPDMSVHHHQD